MTSLLPQTGGIPLPNPTLISRPFWDGCQRGELLFQRCQVCHTAVWSPAHMCSTCYSTNLEWERSNGEGEVYSWTVVWRPQTPEFVVPYAAVIMRMDEGYDILSNMIECEPDAIHVGMRARVTFHKLTDDITLPYFVPIG
jgi:uncharacterized OB-fold protein